MSKVLDYYEFNERVCTSDSDGKSIFVWRVENDGSLTLTQKLTTDHGVIAHMSVGSAE
jgi:hypothetical protein